MVTWSNIKLESLMHIETGSRNTENKIDGGHYPFFVRSQHVEYIDDYTFDCEAVLTAGDGVGTGKVFHYINGKFDAHQRVYVMSQFNRIDGKYFYYYFSRYFYDEVSKYTAKSSVDSVRRSMIADMEIPLPPLPEQRAIASALSDADKYITALENLIAKKRAIKQGAMQELLTGKRRLPGFEGDWVEKPLCEIADNIIMGQSPDSQYYNIKRIGLPLVQGNADIKDRVTIMRFFTSVITKQCNKDDFIMTVRAPVGNVAKADFECCLGRGVCAIKGNDYIYQLLIYFEPGWEAMSTGSTFDSISGNELREVKFNLPASKKEQAAIATLLSDMDAEIDALTSKLKKARQIKQGMMSELLTGRIRLIQEETDNGENKRNGAEDAKPCNCLVPGQSNSWV